MQLDVHRSAPAARTSAAPSGGSRKTTRLRPSARTTSKYVLCRGFGVHQRSSTSHSSRTASTATPATDRGAPSAPRLDLDRPRPVDLRPSSTSRSEPNGARIARRSGTREPGSTSSTRRTASRPAAARTWRTASVSRPRRSSAGRARERPPARRPRARARAPAGRARRPGREARRAAGRAPAAAARSSALALRSDDLAAPAAAGGEPGLEPQPADRPRRARPGWASSRSTSSPSACSSCWPEAASGSPSRHSISLARAARAQRLVGAAGEPQRPQPELAEAVGDRRRPAAPRARPGCGPRAARACRGTPPPPLRVRGRRRRARSAAASLHRQVADGRFASSRAATGSETHRRRPAGAHPHRRGAGAEPVRPGADPGAGGRAPAGPARAPLGGAP